MNIGIEIEVLHVVSDNDVENQEDGIEIDLALCKSEIYKIYHIDYTKPYSKTKSILSSAGLDFIVNESYASLNKRIEHFITFKFN
jgi:hypothetical protein